MFQPLPTASMSVRQLFDDPHRLMVPIYQRPFSWSVKEVGQLLEDVANAAGIDEGTELEADYFLGAILLLEMTGGSTQDVGEGTSASKFEIVDGQQRLVTLMILACALRDLEPNSESQIARTLDGLARLQNASSQKAARIGLSVEDGNVMFDYVIAPGGSLRSTPDDRQLDAGQRSVIQARNRLLEDLSVFSDEQRRRLADYICERCHFVVVTTTDIDRAHRIFMILNDRGRPLEKKDILKAEVLRAIEPQHREEAFSVWRDVESMLDDQVEQFLSHLRSVYGHHRMQVIAGIRKVVSEAQNERAFIHEILHPMARSYAMILSARDPAADIPDKLRRVLAGLSRLSGSEWVPAALLVLSEDLTVERKRAYLDEIERAALLMRVLCLGSGKRQTRFAKITSQLAQEVLPDPTSLFEPSREELRTISFNLRDLHARNVQACKGLLLRINDEIQPHALYANPSDYTIEHILPQRPKAKSLWRTWFPDSEKRIELTGSLGNLVLVSHKHNLLARNDEYDRKKQVYSADDSSVQRLAVCAQTLESETWSEVQIRTREAGLIELVNRTWRLDLEVNGIDDAAA